MRAVSQFRVKANGLFDREAALGTLAAHAVDGLHLLDTDSAELTRSIAVHGDPQPVTVRLDAEAAAVSTATHDEGVNEEIAARVRFWFDLDTDVNRVNIHLGAHPVFAEQVRSRPGIRITRFHAPFEAVILTVLGQQVSFAAGRLFGARLVAAYGTTPIKVHRESGLRCFPSPAVLSSVPSEELRAAIGLTGIRARNVHEVASLFAGAGDPEQLPERTELHALHGVGPWTLDYPAIRASTDTDAFPATDAVLRRTLAAADQDADAARVASWCPYRSYAASRLWAGAL